MFIARVNFISVIISWICSAVLYKLTAWNASSNLLNKTLSSRCLTYIVISHLHCHIIVHHCRTNRTAARTCGAPNKYSLRNIKINNNKFYEFASLALGPFKSPSPENFSWLSPLLLTLHPLSSSLLCDVEVNALIPHSRPIIISCDGHWEF